MNPNAAIESVMTTITRSFPLQLLSLTLSTFYFLLKLSTQKVLYHQLFKPIRLLNLDNVICILKVLSLILCNALCEFLVFFFIIFSLCFKFCLDDEKVEGKGSNIKIFSWILCFTFVL